MKKIIPGEFIKEVIGHHSESEYLFFYKKLKIEELDFDNINKFKVDSMEAYNFLDWLCQKFKLTLTINIINEPNSITYKFGLIIEKESYSYFKKMRYNDLGLKVYHESSSGIILEYKYAKNGKLKYIREKFKAGRWKYKEKYKYDKFDNKVFEKIGHSKRFWRYDCTGKILQYYKEPNCEKFYNQFGILILEKSSTHEMMFNDSGKILSQKKFNFHDGSLFHQENYIYNDKDEVIDFQFYNKNYDKFYELTYELEKLT